jgi:MFS family permease
MLSLAPYAQLLQHPSVRELFLASALGRLPIGIAGLAILLLAQQSSSSYALGGLASGCYVAGLAAVAPLLGRSIDRFGPRPTLLACAFAYPAALGALAAAFTSRAPAWVALALAVAAGASFPPITACMRTFFKQRFAEDARLAAAYSLESVLIEILFIAGPMLVALVVGFASPAAAVFLAAACGFSGTLLFVRSRGLAEWRLAPRHSASLFGPLGDPAFVRLIAVVLLYASAFGLVEIGVTAYAIERGAPALAGVLLAAMSIGSAAGGLVYGARTWGLPLARQFPTTLALMGLGIAPLALALPAWLWALWCVLAGIVMAPALIMQSMLVARASRPEHSTEAFTWSATGLLAGVGFGLALGGQLLESARPPAVFGAAAAASLLAAVLALRLVRRPC